jgi:hypothetical protein
MPSGNKITARKMPTALGSGMVGEDFTGTAPTNARGEASRTAVRTWRMPLTHRTTMHSAPTAQIAQSPHIAIDIQSRGSVTRRESGMLENRGVENGSFTCSMANEN